MPDNNDKVQTESVETSMPGESKSGSSHGIFLSQVLNEFSTEKRNGSETTPERSFGSSAREALPPFSIGEKTIGPQAESTKAAKPESIKSTDPTDDDISYFADVLPAGPGVRERYNDAATKFYTTFTGGDIRTVPDEIKKDYFDKQKQFYDQIRPQVTEILIDFNALSRDVGTTLIDAAKKSQIIGIGEMHTDADYSRSYCATLMKGLHDEGKVTHLAVEMPARLQPIFDRYNAGKDEFKIPEKLIGADGKEDTSAQAKAALEMLRMIQASQPSWVTLVRGAHDAGIKIVCIDDDMTMHPQPTGGEHLFDYDHYADRDKIMKEHISSLLADGAETKSNPKVLMWLGQDHLASRKVAEQKDKSVVELLKDELPAGTVSTFFTQTNESGDFSANKSGTLVPLTEKVSRPVAFPTKDTEGNPNKIGKLPAYRDGWRSSSVRPTDLSGFDHVIIYPSKHH